MFRFKPLGFCLLLVWLAQAWAGDMAYLAAPAAQADSALDQTAAATSAQLSKPALLPRVIEVGEQKPDFSRAAMRTSLPASAAGGLCAYDRQLPPSKMAFPYLAQGPPLV